MQVLPYGSRALLIECAPDEVLGLLAAVDSARIRGVVETVPGAQSVLVRLTRSADLADTSESLCRLTPAVAAPSESPLVTLTVTYDGPDLVHVAEQTGLSVDEVVRRHIGGNYTVMFCGFAPGFAYMSGTDTKLQLPRRGSPRSNVPAGSVAIAADYCAVYPQSSPGGWHLIGTCGEWLLDVDRDPPARLLPGTRVRFEAL